MRLQLAETKSKSMEKQTKAEILRQENAKKAKKAADELFTGEKWIKIEDGIYLSPRRPIGKKTRYQDELKIARILKKLGSTVYLTPEIRSEPGKKYDAIVDGLKFEFKNVGGNANTLFTHFLNSRSQAPNVFINLENSILTQRETISALYGARNSKTHITKRGNVIKGYTDYNKFDGGSIILKLKGHKNLLYLNVDDLKLP